MGQHVDIIRRVAMKKLLFRERDVTEAGASPSCLDDARVFGFVLPHGHGVWSHPDYEPTRYELVQIRMAKAVFWGPSALWLHGALCRQLIRSAQFEAESTFRQARSLSERALQQGRQLTS